MNRRDALKSLAALPLVGGLTAQILAVDEPCACDCDCSQEDSQPCVTLQISGESLDYFRGPGNVWTPAETKPGFPLDFVWDWSDTLKNVASARFVDVSMVEAMGEGLQCLSLSRFSNDVFDQCCVTLGIS